MRVRKSITVIGMVFIAIFAVYLYVKPEKEIKPVGLENEKTISRYDVTGDGKRDRVKITCTRPNENWEDFGDEWQIMVNGECVHRILADWGSCRPNVQLYQVSKKRVYLGIEEQAPDNDDIYGYALFQVDHEKLQKVCDFYNPIAGSITNFHYYVNISKMTSKSMTTKCSDQLYATGRIVWRMNYAYQDGEWQETENVYDVSYNPENEWLDRSSGWTANRKLSVYTTTSLEQERFIVEKGEVVKILKLCIQDGNTYLQLTNQSGETGWIQNPKEYCEGYFEEVHFAG